MKVLLLLCFVIGIFVATGVIFSSIENHSVESDSVAQSALRQTIERAKPLTDALGAYFATNHYYPKSVCSLANWNLAWGEFYYGHFPGSVSTVYKSPACHEEGKTFDKMHAANDDFKKRFSDFSARCIMGYSEIDLISPPLPQAGNPNRWNETTVYGKYSSSDTKWALAWCYQGSSGRGGQPSHGGDCPKDGFPVADSDKFTHIKTHSHHPIQCNVREPVEP